MVSPKVISSPKSAKPPKPGSSKSHLKDLVVGNEKAKSASKSATIDKLKSGTTLEKSASKETMVGPKPGLKPAKSTTPPANPPTKPGAAKSDSKIEQQVGAKQ